VNDGSHVTVTGASGQVGRSLVRRLSADGVAVRTANRGESPEAAFAGARAVAHLAGTLQPRRGDSYRSANVDTVLATIDAARRTGVERIVFLSYVGADPESPNEYLRCKGEAEQALLGSELEATVLRLPHLIGSRDEPGPTAGAFVRRGWRPVVVPGGGRQRWAPVLVDDVSHVLAHVLTGGSPAGVHELAGPEVFEVDGLVELLNRGPVPTVHAPPLLLRAVARLPGGPPQALFDVIVRDSLPEGPPTDALAAFGVRLRSPREVWAPPGQSDSPGSSGAAR
jgi:NADH dehydrogenase